MLDAYLTPCAGFSGDEANELAEQAADRDAGGYSGVRRSRRLAKVEVGLEGVDGIHRRSPREHVDGASAGGEEAPPHAVPSASRYVWRGQDERTRAEPGIGRRWFRLEDVDRRPDLARGQPVPQWSCSTTAIRVTSTKAAPVGRAAIVSAPTIPAWPAWAECRPRRFPRFGPARGGNPHD